MTRKEEIKQAASEHYVSNGHDRLVFREGAKWADQTMIEKALEWIKTNIRPYYSDVKYHYDDFIKAMEE